VQTQSMKFKAVLLRKAKYLTKVKYYYRELRKSANIVRCLYAGN